MVGEVVVVVSCCIRCRYCCVAGAATGRGRPSTSAGALPPANEGHAHMVRDLTSGTITCPLRSHTILSHAPSGPTRYYHMPPQVPSFTPLYLHAGTPLTPSPPVPACGYPPSPPVPACWYPPSPPVPACWYPFPPYLHAGTPLPPLALPAPAMNIFFVKHQKIC